MVMFSSHGILSKNLIPVLKIIIEINLASSVPTENPETVSGCVKHGDHARFRNAATVSASNGHQLSDAKTDT